MSKAVSIFATILFLLQPLSTLAVFSSEIFFVDPAFDREGRTFVESRLYYTGEHAYFFLDKNFETTFSGNFSVDFGVSVRELAKEFDETIYPKTRKLLGSEWSPGIDNDPRIFVLLTPIKGGAGGYFRIEDEYPKSTHANSNEREMLYLNADAVTSRIAPSYLAHEFQHLIHFYQKEKLGGVRDDTWLNEAFSEYMPTFLGYNTFWEGSYLAARAQDFLNFPPDSLIHWGGTAADHASVNLFIHYLVSEYGEGIFSRIIESSNGGVTSLEDALASFGSDFQTVFTDWTVANYINNITPQDGDRYAYKLPLLFYGNFHTSPRATFNVIVGQKSSSSFSLGDWQADSYKIRPAALGPTGGNTLEVRFNGQDQNSNFVVSLVTTDFSGANRIARVSLTQQQDAVLTLPGFGVDISSIALVVSSQHDLTARDRSVKQFSIETALQKDVSPSPLYADGSLLRAAGDTKVYVIKSGTKRWIQSPEIFNGYGHLRWENIVEVPPAVLASFTESFLIRRDGDYRVYEADAKGTKRWLNMSAARFEASGRKWDQIFIVNENEDKWFQRGTDITSENRI